MTARGAFLSLRHRILPVSKDQYLKRNDLTVGFQLSEKTTQKFIITDGINSYVTLKQTGKVKGGILMNIPPYIMLASLDHFDSDRTN